jgi:hypothetical protein
MTKDEAYFTYAHLRKSDNQVFYIGKGDLSRIKSTSSRNPFWKNTVKKHGLITQKLSKWKTEKEAFEHEKFLILCFKDIGIHLTNMTGGGEGMSNPSKEVREKMSLNNGMKRPEVSKKISLARKGKHLSDEHKLKLSKVQTGRKLSEKTKQKMSDRFLKEIPIETKQKMSESAKKAWSKRKEKMNG